MTNNWTNEIIIDFINEIHLHPELWNVETGLYKNKVAKKDGWALVAEKYGISSDEAYKKFRSLRTYAKNEEKKKKCGSAGGKPVKWFAYDAISFILSQDNPNPELDSENASVNINESLEIDISVDQEDDVESEAHDSLLSSVPIIKRRPSKKPKVANLMLEKARHIIREVGEHRRNEYAGFGEHIANKLCKYDAYTRAQAEFRIMQVLFECDMGMHRNPASSTYTHSPDNNSRTGASTSQSQYSDASPTHSAQQNNLDHIYVSRSQI